MHTRPRVSQLVIVAVLTALFAVVAGKAIAQQGPEAPAISLEAVMGQAQQTAGGSVRPPENAVVPVPMEPGVGRDRDAEPAGPKNPLDPLGVRGPNSSATLWAEVRHGQTFTTQASNPNAAFLVQDAGVGWQELRSREGVLQIWTAWALAGIVGVLLVFYLLRGRIRVEHGLSGKLIERFKGWERFGHWLLATSFILLALTGLNLLFGKDYLMPLIGKEAFAQVTYAGKWIHNNVAWAFMVALVWIFVAWVVHNLPSKYDLIWIAKGGGLFVKGVHPPSRKFNAGQKLIFWSTIVLGASVSASGLSLLFPYELPMFAGTFQILNDWGISQFVLGRTLPTDLTPIQEMQYAQVWHTIVAVAMIVIIVAHIYIGSVGMQGAFDAMGSGKVDRNWALEHHNLWVEEEDAKARAAGRAPDAGRAAATPAE